MPLATPTAIPIWHGVLLLTPALAALAAAASTRTTSARTAWRTAQAATAMMLVASCAGVAVRIATQDRADALLRADAVGVAMSVLVSFVGWVVVRYSANYLTGDPHERRYVGRLLATLAAVSVVIVANHLVLLVAAWTAASLTLHGLLTFFGDRPPAVAAAHKKFVLARAADVGMLGAAVAFQGAFGTMRIDRIVAAASASATLPAGARVGVALVALAALLKSAQLPFHGWLIQVMEAPTPVSALLHAGVVNLGGFVLLRLAPVVDRAVETRTLLVLVGTATALIGALVMTTRVSVKVALAWSTCAQMGFMLMECGLGAWEMALVHLLAHSLYKAHAFLGAGGVVRQTQRRQLLRASPAPGPGARSIGLALAVAVTLAAGWSVGRLPFVEGTPRSIWVLGGILALALVPLVTASPGPLPRRRSVESTSVGGALAVAVASFGLHALAGRLVPRGLDAPSVLLVAVAVSFAALFALQTLAAVAPAHRLLRRLYPWIYGGLFLDEAFTRAAFSIWPPPAPRPRAAVLPEPAGVPLFAWAAPAHAPTPPLLAVVPAALDRSPA